MKQNVPPVSLLENIQKVPLAVYIYLFIKQKQTVCMLYALHFLCIFTFLSELYLQLRLRSAQSGQTKVPYSQD